MRSIHPSHQRPARAPSGWARTGPIFAHLDPLPEDPEDDWDLCDPDPTSEVWGPPEFEEEEEPLPEHGDFWPDNDDEE